MNTEPGRLNPGTAKPPTGSPKSAGKKCEGLNKGGENLKRYWLAQRRMELGLKSCEVADALGISPASYCLVEQGKRQQKMSLPFALALANVLKLTVDEVIAREGLR